MKCQFYQTKKPSCAKRAEVKVFDGCDKLGIVCAKHALVLRRDYVDLRFVPIREQKRVRTA